MTESFHSNLWLIAVVVTIFSCTNDPKIVDSCGDGIVDPGEECDQTTGGQTCASLGHYSLTGTLSCTADCRFDRSECGGRCGDNVVEPLQDEACDLTNLNGASCVSLGFSGGALACAQDCGFDTSACVNLCGNGIRDTGEDCDDGNAQDGDGCSTACDVERGWSCDEATPNHCATSCGDGIAAGAEACDLEDFGDATCATHGYHAGELACTDACVVVTDGCLAAGRCGDGTVQDAYEDCDGTELDGGTCDQLGYHGGVLSCDDVCAYVVTDCETVGRCGDGILQSGYGEDCDGADLGETDCVQLGFYGGALSCDVECNYETAACVLVGSCGDGVMQAGFGEACDGAALDAQTCTTLGHYDGQLACDGTCAFDFNACGGSCGDSVIQAGFGEACDGLSLGGRTCRTEGFFTGALACSGSCGAIVETGCRDVARLSVGFYHVCAMLDDGHVTCWGSNGSGQLGDGTVVVTRTSPTLVASLDSVVSVSAGGSHTCAVLTDGTARCWGNNLWLQLGSGLTGDSSTPLPVQGLTGAVGITAGTGHTCAWLSGGTVRCWGSGSAGQLGNGVFSNSGVPVTVSGLNTVIAVDAGEEFTCAMLQDQSLRCWGRNNSGQLGNSLTEDSAVPVAVSLGTSVTSFSTGRLHACAALSTGTVRCWGYNQNGQLGNQITTTSPTPIPVEVTGLTEALSVSCGAAHTCAVLSDGTGRCWGFNNHGQLGDNSSTQRTSPVSVSGLSGASSMSLGYESTCAWDGSGKHVWCWGRNAVGQLGDGTTTGRFVPVGVLP